MIAIGKTLLSEDVFDQLFACDLSACKGACCVEGESGAPLEEQELAKLEEVFDEVKPYLRNEGLQAIEKVGLFEIDSDGDFVTPIVGGRECAYATFDENGTAKCGIEQAWRDGKTDWQKPISCHLYPIRIKELRDYTALNYHQWRICGDARTCGAQSGISVLEFCKSSLIRKFGAAWYQEALEVYQQWKAQRS